MLNHRKRKRLPKPQDIVMMWRALQAAVPMDSKPYHGVRESYRGVINYRIASSTNEKQWMVDVYHGTYFVVTFRNLTQPCPSIPSAIGHLRRMLGLKDVHQTGTKTRR
jgi:hypothetical protein